MVDPWVLAVLLLLVGLMIAAMEIFIPSGGILAFLAVVSLVGAVVMAFRQSPTVGLIGLCVVIIGLPVVVVLALKIWPHTPIGRQVLLRAPSSEDVLPDSPNRNLDHLVGRIGTAKSQMLPGGAVVIDGRSLDAISEGTAIDAGQPIRVVQVRGREVIVRPLVEGEETEASRSDDEAGDNPLSRPVDSIGEDPFDLPPA